jgi:hypothetical protein
MGRVAFLLHGGKLNLARGSHPPHLLFSQGIRSYVRFRSAFVPTEKAFLGTNSEFFGVYFLDLKASARSNGVSRPLVGSEASSHDYPNNSNEALSVTSATDRLAGLDRVANWPSARHRDDLPTVA